ncbi:hypothetical protein M378DRAFT_92011, partial [Amanita muscaria Koide BX008]
DSRTRSDRVLRQVEAWQTQLHVLVDAYLQWRHSGVPQRDNTSPSWSMHTVTMSESRSESFIHASDAKYINETLVRNGYLGASPDQPTLAFNFNVCEVYRQLHRVCPHLGIDGFTRALNHLHKIPRQSHLADQFRCAYDCYLEMMYDIDCHVNMMIGRSLSTSLKTTLCPPCLHVTKQEPSLTYSVLVAMDGNNSLKLVDSMFRGGSPRKDERDALSLRWINPDEVDRFKDDVGRKPHPSGNNSNNNADPDWLRHVEDNTGASVVPDRLPVCIECWKNAGPESRKKMLALFLVSGIFLAVCRHGHVLAICDMIRSGEL